MLADLERRGGVSQHMSPLVSVADAGALLQASGLALPTVDTEIISIGYPDAWTLWHHLRCMGESNANLRRSASSLDNMLAAAATYKEVYGDADGNVPGTFQARAPGVLRVKSETEARRVGGVRCSCSRRGAGTPPPCTYSPGPVLFPAAGDLPNWVGAARVAAAAARARERADLAQGSGPA